MPWFGFTLHAITLPWKHTACTWQETYLHCSIPLAHFCAWDVQWFQVKAVLKCFRQEAQVCANRRARNPSWPDDYSDHQELCIFSCWDCFQQKKRAVLTRNKEATIIFYQENSNNKKKNMAKRQLDSSALVANHCRWSEESRVHRSQKHIGWEPSCHQHKYYNLYVSPNAMSARE